MGRVHYSAAVAPPPFAKSSNFFDYRLHRLPRSVIIRNAVVIILTVLSMKPFIFSSSKKLSKFLAFRPTRSSFNHRIKDLLILIFSLIYLTLFFQLSLTFPLPLLSTRMSNYKKKKARSITVKLLINLGIIQIKFRLKTLIHSSSSFFLLSSLFTLSSSCN